MNFSFTKTCRWKLNSRLFKYEKENTQEISLSTDKINLTRFKFPSNISILLLIGCGSLFSICTGCKKYVQIGDAPNKLPASAVFADSSDATSAILGMYSSVMAYSSFPAFFNGYATVYTGLASDELYPSNSSNSDDLQFYSNTITPMGNSTDANFWSNAYTYIYQANACIAGLQTSTTLSTTVKNQLMGEALTFRALCYFYLVNMFGAVPLITTTDYHVNASVPRTSVDTVYTQIINDLASAESLMTPNYPSKGRVRPNQYTASALLAKAYLYTQQWANAQTEASKAINSGLYSLNSNLNGVFLAGSNEAIWQLIPLQQGYETSDGALLLPNYGQVPYTGDIPTYSINTPLLNAFEPGDLRRANWVDSNIVNGTNYYFAFKYKLGQDYNSSPSEYYMICRLAEQYLIRAEAEAQQGQSAAITDLNTVRTRAGLVGYAGATDQNSVLSAIYHERQIELFCEMGNRWFDLKRTGKADSIMSIVTPTKGGSWSSNWQLFPVPLDQIQLNPFLTQNTGY